LREAYTELRDDLAEEAAAIEARVIQPATSARDYIQPIRRTIKKRENKRLDYEKCQDKVQKLQRKPGKTPKEDTALAKAEEEMTRIAEVWAAPCWIYTQFGCTNLED
jgi:amphiphysin